MTLLDTLCWTNTAITLMILSRCCEMSGAFNYKEIGRTALGPTVGAVAQFIVAGYTLGSCISYIVLIGGPHASLLALCGAMGPTLFLHVVLNFGGLWHVRLCSASA